MEWSKNTEGLPSTGYRLQLGDLQTESNFHNSELFKMGLEQNWKELNQQITITYWWLSPSSDV